MSLVEAIKSYPDIFTLTPATQELITAAEKELDVTFSKEYVEYLAEFGVAIFNGHEFTGLCDGKRLDVIRITKEQRAFHKYIPDNLFVVECLDIDDIVVWQDAVGTVYASTPSSKPKKIANSLVEYVRN